MTTIIVLTPHIGKSRSAAVSDVPLDDGQRGIHATYITDQSTDDANGPNLTIFAER